MVSHSPYVTLFSSRLFKSHAFQALATLISTIKTQFLLLPWHPIFILSLSNPSFSPKVNHFECFEEEVEEEVEEEEEEEEVR